MPLIGEAMPRKDLHVFYVLDTSGSMEGSKISMLNHAMEETLETLKDVAKHNGDANLKIAVLEFNTGCRWITDNGPENMGDFEWEYLKAGGLTDIGAALKELSSKMSIHAWLNSMMGALMPVVIFMTDGYATDSWQKELDNARKNRWFARATKIGFALGDDADKKMIASVVGNSEAVVQTNDLELFKRLIRIVSVTSSMLKSKPNTEEATGADIVRQGAEEAGVDVKELVETLPEGEYKPEPPVLPTRKPNPDPDAEWDGADGGDW